MRTNTQVSDMRIWHVDTSARLSAKAAHEMQTFLHELRKLKKCQRTLDTNHQTLKNDISKNLCYTMTIANFTRKGYYEKERIL